MRASRSVDFERSAVACAPVADAGIAACVFRPAPLFGLGDLNRLIIYGLLLAAPLLAVFGLVSAIRRVERDKKSEAEAKNATPAARAGSWTSFEVPGMIGLWRWNPGPSCSPSGPRPARLVGANHAWRHDA